MNNTQGPVCQSFLSFLTSCSQSSSIFSTYIFYLFLSLTSLLFSFLFISIYLSRSPFVFYLCRLSYFSLSLACLLFLVIVPLSCSFYRSSLLSLARSPLLSPPLSLYLSVSLSLYLCHAFSLSLSHFLSISCHAFSSPPSHLVSLFLLSLYSLLLSLFFALSFSRSPFLALFLFQAIVRCNNFSLSLSSLTKVSQTTLTNKAVFKKLY